MGIKINEGSQITVKSSLDGTEHVPHYNIDVLPDVTLVTGQSIDVGTVTTLPPITFASAQDVNVLTMPDVVLATGSVIDVGTVAGTVTVQGTGLGGEVTVEGTVDIGTMPAVDINSMPDVTLALGETIDVGTVGTITNNVTVVGTGTAGAVVVEGDIAVDSITTVGTITNPVAISTVSGTVNVQYASTPTVNIGTSGLPTVASQHGATTVTTAGTRVQLSGASLPAKRGVLIRAMSTNTLNVYVGGTTVTAANGFFLEPGDSMFFEIDDGNKLWLDADTSLNSVRYHVL